ncbi:hypothetical protein [Rurimicrobium arvi]|uniref:Uncharacterized protein n=1 Tax=Rurimicrobium arvi TaxID=2049916 RepID=A0ABP8N0J3_9BACT
MKAVPRLLVHLFLAIAITAIIAKSGGSDSLILDERQIMWPVALMFVASVWLMQLLLYRRFRNSRPFLKWLLCIVLSIPLSMLWPCWRSVYWHL